MNHWEWMNEHMQWMGSGHWLLMGVWWLVILGGVFIVGFLVGRAGGRGKSSADE